MMTTCPQCQEPYFKRGDWQTICPACFGKSKRAERDALLAELDALEDENASLRAELAQVRALAVRPAIPPDMLGRLIRLCHPDKHGGSQAANDATQWLLAQR